MKSSPLKYVFAVLSLLPIVLYAQTNELKFNLITWSDGVGLGKINSIARDRNGAMWFSDQTNGCITRYDGSTMTNYWHDDNDFNTLGGWYPEYLLADSSGILWIGFYGHGLDKFDTEKNQFTHYKHIPEDATSLGNDTITSLLIDHLGNFWIGTYAGLDLFDPKTGLFIHYSHSADDPASLSHNRIRAMYEDHEGTLWIGTGLAWDLNDQGGLNRFDREKGSFTRYLHDPQNPHSLIDNKVRAIYEDTKGNFWVGTRGDGLHRMNRNTGVFERFTSVNPDVHRPCRPPVSGGYDHITFITEDHEGALWIGTLANGMSRYDPNSHETTFINAQATNTYGFTDNSAWCAHTSSDGLFWIATQESNLFQVQFYQNVIPDYTIDGLATNDIIEDGPGVLWLATSNGLIRKDMNNGAMQQYVNTTDPNSISSNFTNTLSRDKDGYIWVSTVTGLNRFDPAKGTFKRFVHDPQNSESLSFNGIGDLYTDAESNLWICSYGAGLNRLDTKSEKFTVYQHVATDTTSISNDRVNCILPDPSGDLWVGTSQQGGLNRLNILTGTFKHYLKGIDVPALFEDAEGILWVGAGNGLYRYDRTVDQFSFITPLEDFNIFGYILSLIEDDDHNLWIASSSGLFRMDPSRQKFIRFGKTNGINGLNMTLGCAFKSEKGKLYFGTQSGYYAFNPHDLTVLSPSVNVQLTNLWLNGRLVSPGPDSPIRESIQTATQILFHHDENAFSIGFSMINFGNTEDKVIAYTLENYEPDWHTSGPEGQAYYYNLRPGKYKFKIIATNLNSEKWIEKSIDVVITPPWWSRWWAYMLYALCFITLAFFGYRFQKAMWLKAERERTKDKELAQAREIEKAYHELKVTQAQLIQSEKMASLGELTAGIAHEIQNPLNFVNNFSEVNSELIDEMQTELKSGNNDEAITISNNIKDNQEKIGFHGKRADAIVKSMLLHSRSSSNKKELTDINALADEYLRLAYHGLRAKDKSFNATMKTEFDSGIGLVNIVPQDIGRVILNLITNAFYAVTERAKQSSVHSPQSSPITHHPSSITHESVASSQYEPTVTVTTKNLGDKVEIRVKDNGNGIPQQVLDKIFHPFFTTKPVGQGTGLGLSISYDIVKAHGGELKVTTQSSTGTEFIIQLPI